MKCSTVQLPDGGHAIVCGGKRYHSCAVHGAHAEFQCDWRTGQDRTCDAWLCAQCATEVGKNKHLCPRHNDMWKLHPAHGRA